MLEDQKSVVYEYEQINREIVVLFKDVPVIEDESVCKDYIILKMLITQA